MSQVEVREDSLHLKERLIWATPIIASIASILDASFMARWISSEIPGLILTILAAVTGFVVAVTVPKDNREYDQNQLKGPDPTQK